MTSRVIATCFALVSLSATLFAGAMARNTPWRVASVGLVTMICCYLIGRVVGHLAERVVKQHIEQYKRDHPIPEDPATTA